MLLHKAPKQSTCGGTTSPRDDLLTKSPFDRGGIIAVHTTRWRTLRPTWP
ncbi:TPA: hypothetical protein N0F65_002285 [Lagenidium giganteum]|uniref:Uncharacterized protein n=1 Tax=Lagenidium giganteum TaxID=4803 RepID=A0AAV2Z601_9STRA|nr:TPA: hypothetical protein N0F65_002285 [Lagenidium giganteum]